MKIQDIEIKDGYLLVVKIERVNGRDASMTVNMTVATNDFCELGCVAPAAELCWSLRAFSTDGVIDKPSLKAKVQAIYGRTTTRRLLDNSTELRMLLWERKEPKKMTVAEVCEALGYEVEIVSDKEDRE